MRFPRTLPALPGPTLLMILLPAAVLPACGSDEDPPRSSFVTILGAHSRTFDLSAVYGMEVKCTEKKAEVVSGTCSCDCVCQGCSTTARCTQNCLNTNCMNECSLACMTKNCGSAQSGQGDCPAQPQKSDGVGLEYEAATQPGKDTGQFFRFKIKKMDVKDSQRLQIDFGKVGLSYEVDVGFTTGAGVLYKYVFNTAKRAEISTDYNSRCSFELSQQKLDDATRRYWGSVSCVMLFADTTSKDYTNTPFNAFVDLVGLFDCKAAATY